MDTLATGSLVPTPNSVSTPKSETDLNGKLTRFQKPFYARLKIRFLLDNGPSTKRLKVEPIEHQSSASIVEEIARGKFELEQDKKNAEKKIVILEAQNKELEEKKSELEESLKISNSEHAKKNSQIVELTKALTTYRKLKILKLKMPKISCNFEFLKTFKFTFRTDLSKSNEDFFGSQGDQWFP